MDLDKIIKSAQSYLWLWHTRKNKSCVIVWRMHISERFDLNNIYSVYFTRSHNFDYIKIYT